MFSKFASFQYELSSLGQVNIPLLISWDVETNLILTIHNGFFGRNFVLFFTFQIVKPSEVDTIFCPFDAGISQTKHELRSGDFRHV